MKPKVVLIIAVILGLITSGLVYYMMDNSQSESVATKLAPVVVATQNIQSREMIKKGSVQIKQVPKEAIHRQAITSLSQVTGKLALKEIIAGEQILKPRLLAEKDLRSVLAFNLSDKQRAVTVAVNEIRGVAGFLTPGDYVDIIGVFASNLNQGAISKTVLQNLKVLAVAQDMINDRKQKPKVTKSVTLAVNLDEAEKLILADNKGDIRLILRSIKDKSRVVSNGIEFDKIVGEEPKEEKQEVKPKAVQKPEPVSKKATDKKIEESDKTEEVTKTKEITNKKIEVIRGEKKSYIQVPLEDRE
jgi:pilus assembly protein CpaB